MRSKEWAECQKRQLKDYEAGATVFSNNASKSEEVLANILNSIGGKCLDVGCGVLSKPNYMELADRVTFTGIDPFEGEPKLFDFVQGFAEELPFERETFDIVLFATSLDHIEEPQKALIQALRVLKQKGYMVVWGSFRNPDDELYQQWLKTGGMIYNHVYAFTIESLTEMAKGFELLETVQLEKSHNKILIYQK